MEMASAVLPTNGHHRARRQWASRAYTPRAASPATRLAASTSTAPTCPPAPVPAPSLSVRSTPTSRMTAQAASAAATAAATTARLLLMVVRIVFLPRWRLATHHPAGGRARHPPDDGVRAGAAS